MASEIDPTDQIDHLGGPDESENEVQKTPEEELLDLRREVAATKEELSRLTEEHSRDLASARQSIFQSMEAEFTCSICHELLVEATTLPCAHSFCELCLRVWLRRNNPGSSRKACPICRQRIQTKAVHSVMLDNAIDKMIEAMDEDRREHRVVLKRQRVEEMTAEENEDRDRVRNMIYRPGEHDRDEDRRRDREDEDRRGRARTNNHGQRRRSVSRSPPRFRNGAPRHAPYFIPQPYQNNNIVNNWSSVHARLGTQPVVPGHPSHPAHRLHQNIGSNYPLVIVPNYPLFHNGFQRGSINGTHVTPFNHGQQHGL